MLVRVRVFPGMRKETIEQVDRTTFVMKLKEKAERGAANRRVREVLAEEFQVPLLHVRLKTGAQSPSKSFEIMSVV